MTRSRERRVALDILFQADVTGEDPLVVLAEWTGAGREVRAFAAELVMGVAADLPALDELIGRHAEGWTVQRMAAVDRSILRLATHELRSRPDVPVGAAIDEAVKAAKELSTAESGGFVNGILGRIAEELQGADRS